MAARTAGGSQMQHTSQAYHTVKTEPSQIVYQYIQ